MKIHLYDAKADTIIESREVEDSERRAAMKEMLAPYAKDYTVCGFSDAELPKHRRYFPGQTIVKVAGYRVPSEGNPVIGSHFVIAVR